MLDLDGFCQDRGLTICQFNKRDDIVGAGPA